MDMMNELLKEIQQEEKQEEKQMESMVHGAFDAVEIQNKEGKVIQIINDKSIEL